MEKTGFGASISVEVVKGVKQNALVRSIWNFECHDKDGNLKWQEKVSNIVTNEGLAKLLNVMFMGGTQILDDDWYVAITEDGSSATSASTYAVPIVSECTGYNELTRPIYVGSQTNQQVDNISNKAVFTMSDPYDLLGGILVGGGTDGDVKGDAAGGGTLYCSVDFAELKPVVATDVVSIAITLTAADIPA